MMKIEKLSEKNLKEVLEYLFPNSEVQAQVRYKAFNRTFIVDYVVDNYIIEYDGPTHFRQSDTQWRDYLLKIVAKKNQCHLVRIPYFLQPTKEVMEWAFGKTFERIIEVTYKQGFWDKKIDPPGYFNSYGLKIYKHIRELLPHRVDDEITKSIQSHIDNSTPEKYVASYAKWYGVNNVNHSIISELLGILPPE